MENNTFYTKRNLVLFSLFAFAAMAFSLLYLANFITEQNSTPEDTAAFTAGYQFYLDAYLWPFQTSTFQPKYDLTLFYADDHSSSLPLNFTNVEYQMCINPASNPTHRNLYNYFGNANWKDESNTTPTWACYALGNGTTLPGGRNTVSLGSYTKIGGNATWAKTVAQVTTFMNGQDTAGFNKKEEFQTKAVVSYNGIIDDQVLGEKIRFDSEASKPTANLEVSPSDTNFKFSLSQIKPVSPNTSVTNGGFTYADYKFCMNPATNNSHKQIYQYFFISQANWKSDNNTVPARACYIIWRDTTSTISSGTMSIGLIWTDLNKLVADKTLSQLQTFIKNEAAKGTVDPNVKVNSGVSLSINGVVNDLIGGNDITLCGSSCVPATPTPSTTPSTVTPTPNISTTPTNTPQLSPTPQQPTGMYSTEVYLAELNGKQYIFERNCETNNKVSGETITTRCGTGWKSYPLSELAGSDDTFAAVLQEAGSIDSLNMFMYPQGDLQYVRQTAVVNGKDIYQRDCKVQSNKAKCINEAWVKQQSVGGTELGLPADAFSTPNNPTVRGFDMSILNFDYNDSSQNQLRQVILSADGKTQWTRTCTLNPNSAPSNCNNWNPAVISEQNTAISGLEVLEGVDHHIQVFNNVIQIRQSWLNQNGSAFVTRLCPRNNSGTFDCNLSTADPDENKWSKVNISSLGLPGNANKVTWMDQFISYSREFDMDPVEISTNVECSNKTVTALDGGFYTGGRVDYTINLKTPAPGPKGTVVVRDVVSNRLTIVQSKIPNYCQVKTANVNSSVLGVSDTVVENGSVYISVVLLSIVGGIAIYVIVVHNKERINSELFKNKPYLAGLLGSAVILVISGSIMLLVRDNFAPSDTPAATQTFLECKLPEGTQSLTFRAKIKDTALSGEVINNEAEVFTGSNPEVETCSVDFTVVENFGTIIPTEEPDPTPSYTPVPSETPTATPTDEPGITQTPTAIPTPTEEPVLTATPTASITPTVPLEGVVCGAADVNGDGRFTILDFGGYQIGFASFYLSKCADRFENYGACGGKDANQDGVVNIIDLGSQNYGFAPRYGRETCDLDQLQ